jgi:uncharacterized membrane protein required for colicin V production
VDSHLLRIEETRISQNSIITYELAHDYLIDKIELDPMLQNRKIAQELVNYKTRNFTRNDKLLLSSEELALIIPEESRLNLNESSQALILQSRNKIRKKRIQGVVGFVATVGFLAIAQYFYYGIRNSPSITLPPLTTQIPPNDGGGISIPSFFWVFVYLFSMIGWMRGWGKEMLVTFGVILALALNFLIQRSLSPIWNFPDTEETLFWIRIIFLVVCAYFGYQVVTISYLASRANWVSRSPRDRVQDALFGSILGGFNGYLIVGSILYYIHIADYPYPEFIAKPTTPIILDMVNKMMSYMPPQVLGEPGIYFAVILAFIFVVVVYV